MKIFGLPAAGDEQGLKVPGSINIAFKWDANDVMHIEYSIPFKLLNIQPADRSEVEIGWTVNGIQRLQNTSKDESDGEGEGSHHYGGGEGGGGYGGHRGGGGYGNSSQRKMTEEEMMKEQTYWIKYTLVDVKKAF